MAETGPKSDDKAKDLPKDSQQISDAKADLEALLEAENLPTELNEAELNVFLEREDPNFVQSVSEIGLDKTLHIKEITLSEEEQELADEILIWESSKGLRLKIFRAFPGVAKHSVRIKKIKFKIFNWLRAQWIRFKNFTYFLATDGKKKAVQGIKGIVGSAKAGVAERKENFARLSKLQKLFAIFVIAAAFGTGLFIYRSLTKGVIPPTETLFIPSMESLASDIYEYDPETESEPFYDNLRATQNLLLLPRVVVNLKREGSDHKIPMVALELFVEGSTPEVIVEVKDREAAVKDLIQRTIEDFTFEILDTQDGKKQVCEKIRKEINSILTSGALKRVLIKTVVLKP